MIKSQCIFPLLVLVGLMTACFITKAENHSSTLFEEPDVPIIIQSGENYTSGTPRTPALVPISCFLNDGSGVLTFNFLFPMGDVYVSLMETTTNVVTSGTLLSDSGSDTFYVPGPGSYTLALTLSSGTQYTGQFVY